jgi:hypothetical protein
VYNSLDLIETAQHDLIVRWVRQFGADTSSSGGHDNDGDDALSDGNDDDAPMEK